MQSALNYFFSSKHIPALSARRDFRAASTHAKRKRPSPFPIRLSEAERVYLERKAGDLSLGSYIRQEPLKDFDQRKTRPRRRLHAPTVNQQKVSALLAGLGQSRISNNLNQLAKAANCGTLETSEDVQKQLEEACAAVTCRVFSDQSFL
ncbi:MAG: plasmid mobilization relaxosome protein MobC [Pseudomonadota bacterium]